MKGLNRSLLALVVGIILAAASPVAPVSTPADFQGSWRISKWVGESQGGFGGPDPSSLLGKTVQITAVEFRSPERVCALREAVVKLMDNREIETGLWGGQLIGALRLRRGEIARAFGRRTSAVFTDRDVCVSAVMVDRDHIVDAFGSGVVYLLERVR